MQGEEQSSCTRQEEKRPVCAAESARGRGGCSQTCRASCQVRAMHPSALCLRKSSEQFKESRDVVRLAWSQQDAAGRPFHI